MEFKALKHKTLPETWGVFMEDGSIACTSTPTLHPMSATESDIINYWKKYDSFPDFVNYGLVTVNVTLKP